jgi:hypothetical protein
MTIEKFPRMIIIDDNQVLSVVGTRKAITCEASLSIDKFLWTNSKDIVESNRLLFEELWSKSIDIQKRIATLENGPV